MRISQLSLFIFDLGKAILIPNSARGKHWDEIARAIPKHDALNCRNYWYNNHWDAYRAWFKDGQIDTTRIASLQKAGPSTTPALLE